ncbi:MAG: hypothetical protein M0009_14205 [Deltaproteobacteria bacterium]|nr:hypothetical protein [Deltaproteobacteria bacterium]
MRTLVIIFGLWGAMLFSHPLAANAGEAFQAMKRTFCAPIANEEAMGICQTYWNLRICYGQSREEAFSSCKSLCNNKYGLGTGTGGVCQAYCQNMWTRDN